MRKILLIFYLLISTNLMAAIVDGTDTQTVKETEDTTLNKTVTDMKKISKNVKLQIKKTRNKLKKGEEEEITKYFNYVPKTTCSSAEDMICPPLTLTFKKDHVVMIDYINPIAGEVKCSVYKKDEDEDLWTNWNKEQQMASVYSEVFVHKICISKFSEANNIDNTGTINDIREIVKERERELENIRLSYEVDFTANGGEKFLDMGDWLDALATVDAEKIDIEKTLKQGIINTTENYTTIPNGMIASGYKAAFESVLRNNNGDMAERDRQKIISDSIAYSSKVKHIADSNYVMYLDFFTNANSYINEIVVVLLILLLLKNLSSWGLKTTTENFSKTQNRQNHTHRAILGFSVLLLFFVGENNVINIPDSEGTSKEIEVKSQRIQTLVRELYSFTNELSDGLTRIAITSYLKNLSSTTGHGSLAEVNSLSSELLILEKENEMLYSIDETMCRVVYNEDILINSLKIYRRELSRQRNLTISRGEFTGVRDTNSFSNALDQTMYEFSGGFYGLGSGGVYGEDHRLREQEDIEIILNHFPSSEREAHAISYLAKTNAYDDGGGGFVKDDYFRSSEFEKKNQWLALSGCSYNKKQIILNNKKLDYIETKLKSISKGDEFEKRKVAIKNANEILWKNYAELGYVSMVFLPATSLIIDEKENYDEESTLKKISKALPILAMMNGSGVTDTINNVIGGFSLTKPLSALAAYELIMKMLDVIPMIILIVSGIVSFIIISLLKLWAFMALIFVVIYAFSESQEEKIWGAISRVFIIGFSSVLLVVSLFLTIWAMSLVDNLEHILISNFFDAMLTLSDESITTYVVYGVSHALFILAKILLTLAIVFKLPKYFYDILGVKADDASEGFQNYMQESITRQGTKGL